MFDKIRLWWVLDEAAETQTADNPFSPVTPEQRRDTVPMLTLAFGWGFLITGLITGGQLGAGVTFWPDLIFASFIYQSALYYSKDRFQGKSPNSNNKSDPILVHPEIRKNLLYIKAVNEGIRGLMLYTGYYTSR